MKADATLDCIGLYCPMPIAHTSHKLKEMKAGQVLEILADDEGIKEDQEFKDLAKNIALQIASMGPVSVSRDDFPEDILNEQGEIFKKQAIESGKPDNIIEKIVMGKTGKFIIALGAGLGLIGLIVSIIIGLTEGSFTLNSLITIGAIGLILSIVARMMAE